MVTIAASVPASWYKLNTLHLYCPLCAVVTHGIYSERKNTRYQRYHTAYWCWGQIWELVVSCTLIETSQHLHLFGLKSLVKLFMINLCFETTPFWYLISCITMIQCFGIQFHAVGKSRSQLWTHSPWVNVSCVVSWAPCCGTTHTVQEGWPLHCTPGTDCHPQTALGTEADGW